MLVKSILTAKELAEEFRNMNRENYFSFEGYETIINLFEESEEVQELDVIALCCEFCEDLPEDICSAYNYSFNGFSYSNAVEMYGKEAINNELVEMMNEYTMAILLDNGNIFYQEY